MRVVTTVSWIPIHPTHAIERIRILIRFASPLPAKMVTRLGDLIESRRQEAGLGPRTEINQKTFRFAVDTSSSPVVDETSFGWQFKRETGSGAVVEAIVLDPQGLLYESAEYVRWGPFADRYTRLTNDIVSKLAGDVNVQAVALEYFDRFVFDGPVLDAHPGTLVKTELADVLPESARSGREFWHIHRGWFEGEEPHRFLVNQNIDAQPAKRPNGQDIRSVAIYTKVERQANGGDVDLSELGADLNVMHDVSIRVIRDALRDDVQRRVGLA